MKGREVNQDCARFTTLHWAKGKILAEECFVNMGSEPVLAEIRALSLYVATGDVSLADLAGDCSAWASLSAPNVSPYAYQSCLSEKCEKNA